MPLIVAQAYHCTELYDLSGWKDTHTYYHRAELDGGRWQWKAEWYPRLAPGLMLPAYDLGYLIDKLTRVKHDGHTINLDFAKVDDESALITEWWFARLWDIQRTGETIKYGEASITPEDAVAKLAIALFKDNVLSS